MSAKKEHANIHSKRGNNEGCIRRRSDGRWEAIYTAEYKLDGQPIRRSVYGKTRHDVMLKLREILQQIAAEEYVPPQKIRNRDFSDNAKYRTSLQSGTPKTRAGRRVIPLPPKMREVLQVQRKKQLEARLAAGPGWNSNDLVFCSEIGTPYEGRNLTRVLHRTLRKAGLATLGVHSLRHTFAIRALESGMDLRTLSEILGHAKVALTLQLYAHSTIETKRSVMERMDVFL